MTTQENPAKAPAKKAAAPKKAAAAIAPTTRRLFAQGQCHHRSTDGKPDCKKVIVQKGANLCPTHEAVWQKAARKRYAARRAEREATATQPEKLEDALAASVARFATPQLAEKARAKRSAAK